MNWVKFRDNYSISEETCDIKSHERISYCYGQKRKVKERILKQTNNDHVTIDGKSVSASIIYKKVFDKEWVG